MKRLNRITTTTIKACLLAMLATGFFSVSANEVEIVDAKAHQFKDKSWRIAVTLKHEDTGWDHYANEWQVLAPDNKILATRTLYHPHVNEQPFTRNISGVKIPEDITTVRIIARDTVHDLSEMALELDLQTGATKPLTLEALRKLSPQKPQRKS